MKYIRPYNESADILNHTEEDLIAYYTEENVFPFVYNVDENNNVDIYIGGESQSHGYMFDDMNSDDYEIYNPSELLGRIWLDYKIITFWFPFPDKLVFKNVIDELQRQLGYYIWNRGWRTEILDYNKYNLIPIEDYVGLSADDTDIRKQHLMDIQQKAKLKKPEHFGSKADKRPLKWKQALLTSESKDIVGTPVGEINDLWELSNKKLYDPYSDCYIELTDNTFKLIDADDNSLMYEFEIPFPGDESTDNEGNKLYLDSEMEYLDFLDERGKSQYEMSIPELEIIPNTIQEDIQTFTDYQIFESKKYDKKDSAILFTDMVGSSEFWKNHKVSMMNALDKHFKETEKIVKKYNGTIIKTIGDAFMCKFDTLLDSVKAAYDILTDLKENPIKVDKKKIELRIGVSYGEVYEKIHNIQGFNLKDYYGNVVNTASRLESKVSNKGEFTFTSTKQINIDDVEEFLEDKCKIRIIDFKNKDDGKINRSTRLLTDYHKYFVESIQNLKGVDAVRVYNCKIK